MIKLLLVDEERDLCEYLKNFFNPRGYNVYTAMNAGDALTIVKQEKPELVILNINLQGADGWEILRQIKKIFPQIKIIVLSLSNDPDTIEKAKNLGADELVKKPFTIDYLEDVVILKVSSMHKERQPPQILIVDDEEDFRIILREFLKKRFECNISETNNVEEALNLMQKNKFDLIFLDIKMPRRSGADVIKEKEKLDYRPCIWVLTAFDSEEVARKVIDQGADDYLPKSSSLRVLDIKVRDFLSKIGKYRPKDSGDSALQDSEIPS